MSTNSLVREAAVHIVRQPGLRSGPGADPPLPGGHPCVLPAAAKAVVAGAEWGWLG